MRSSRLAVVILLAFSLLAVTGRRGPTVQPPSQKRSDRPNVNGIFIDPVPDKPFSATVEVVSEQKLADGSFNVLHTINHIARDSRGRAHSEPRRFVASLFKNEPPINFFHICDPTSGRDTRLDSYTLIARQVALTSQPLPPAGTVPTVSISQPNATTAIGNLRTRTYETWS